MEGSADFSRWQVEVTLQSLRERFSRNRGDDVTSPLSKLNKRLRSMMRPEFYS